MSVVFIGHLMGGEGGECGGRDVYMCEEGGWRGGGGMCTCVGKEGGEVGGGGSRVPGSLTW